ncbi:MAG: hypothetical protein ACI835_001096 [Planctomycetota bacterium]|jgi:hypothetical protein
MQDDTEWVDRLSAIADRLPEAQLAFAESLARQRERCTLDHFSLTEAQREQASAILTAVALGHEGTEIPDAHEASDPIATLARRVQELRDEKRSIDKKLAEATQELVREVGIGATVGTQEFRVRVGEPRLSVKVTDAASLPDEFKTMQPDRSAILEHVRECADVPTGASVSETKPTVYFSVNK